MTDPSRFHLPGAFAFPAAVASASAAYMETTAVVGPAVPQPGHHVEPTVTIYGIPPAFPNVDRLPLTVPVDVFLGASVLMIVAWHIARARMIPA